jgi:stress-induced morphogen
VLLNSAKAGIRFFTLGVCYVKPNEIKSRLEENYPDGSVDVTDLTGTENHYSVYIASQKFAGLSRIQCHKQVMDVFGPELKTGEVHALTIKTEVIK